MGAVIPPTRLLWVDVETGGLDPRRDALLAVAWQLTDLRGAPLEPVGVRYFAPRAGRAVHAAAAAVNGYDPATWGPVSPLPEAFEILAERSPGTLLAGHQVPFDAAFLDANRGPGVLAAARWRFDYHRCDTASLAVPLLAAGRVPDLRLDTLLAYYGLRPRAGKFHRADEDVDRTAALYRDLLQDRPGAPS